MAKNIIVTIIVTALVVGAGSFYGGMLYGKSQTSGVGNFANLSPAQRQQMFQQGAGRRNGTGTGQATGVNFVMGSIISKDSQSLTVRSADGGSKIVFFSTSTQIMKLASSTVADLNTGETVTINGQANADGSLTAKTIQTQPHVPNFPGAGPNSPNSTPGQ